MASMLDRVGRQIASYLQQPASGYEPFTPADPKALQALIKPGDILLIEGRTHIAGVIKYLTQQEVVMGNLKVSTRLWAGFGMIVAIMVTIVFTGITQMNAIETGVDNIVRGSHNESDALRILDGVNSMRRFQLSALSSEREAGLKDRVSPYAGEEQDVREGVAVETGRPDECHRIGDAERSNPQEGEIDNR